jgi:hypothetical protein
MLHLLKENRVTAPSACWPSELRWREIHWFWRFSWRCRPAPIPISKNRWKQVARMCIHGQSNPERDKWQGRESESEGQLVVQAQAGKWINRLKGEDERSSKAQPWCKMSAPATTCCLAASMAQYRSLNHTASTSPESPQCPFFAPHYGRAAAGINKVSPTAPRQSMP